MGRKSRYEEEPEPKQDLTPMIDVVFLLIVFFMIVTDLAALDVEKIDLPWASEAEKPEVAAQKSGDEIDKVLQVNVMEDGIIKIRGRSMVADPKLRSERYIWLPDFLEIEAAAYEREPAEGPGTPPSALRVNIRADSRSRFKYVQQVFDSCVKNGIYKTSIAATRDDPTKF